MYYSIDHTSDSSFELMKEIKSKLEFKNIVKIDDLTMLELINNNIRILYLKEITGISWLNEKTIGLITSKIFTNYFEILSYIFEQEGLCDELISNFQEKQSDKHLSTLNFIQEICFYAKQMVIESKIPFINNLIDKSILDILISFIKNPCIKEDEKSLEVQIKHCASEVFILIMQSSPSNFIN